MKKKLPIGIESFNEIIKEGFYYVDKTGFIRDLLHFGSKVSLFTRPRRFGKSLNMDMLKAFFEIGTDVSLFEGLEISKEEEVCGKYMGVFPVISVSLKSVEGTTFEDAKDMLGSVVRFEANRFSWLMNSDKLTKYDKLQFEKLLLGDFSKISYLADSFKLLTLLLYKHYDRKVIVLIDEYDVPLEKAYSNGYYPEMTNIIRLLFGGVLKTNDCLKFAVVTGCLRISKESIFTGLNNFIVFTTVDTAYARYFGFTGDEVKEMLEYYDMDTLYSTVKEWYDGYLFGKINVYCPWDVINYIQEHLTDIGASAKMYWIGTSENTIVKMLIRRANSAMKDEIEQLIEGKSINKEIRMELTYQDLDEPQSGRPDTGKDNLWSLLFTTGYLTMLRQSKDAKNYDLIIPNKEIKNIFITQISDWINNTVILGNTVRLEQFYKAVKDGSAKDLEDIFNQYLEDIISIRDTNVAKPMKENFYHGLLLGILGSNSGWLVKSNRETGIGYADILVEIRSEKTGCVFEIKYAEGGNFDTACNIAMQQIKKNRYTDVLKQDGIQIVRQYGIACYKKTCKIVYKCEKTEPR